MVNKDYSMDLVKTRVESAEQIEAFELYYSLGSERSLQLVADKLGRNKRTVQSWSSKYNWGNRVTQRSLEVAKQAGLEELHRETLAIRAEYRKNMDALLEQAYRDIQEGKLQIESIEDLEIVIKLDLLLMGEPTEVVELGVLSGKQENEADCK